MRTVCDSSFTDTTWTNEASHPFEPLPVLYIYIGDPDGATVGGVAQGSGVTLEYVYVGGAWRLF